jgi:hypothetical protein
VSCKSEDKVKVNVTKIGREDVNWIELGQDGLCQLPLAMKELNVLFPNHGNKKKLKTKLRGL